MSGAVKGTVKKALAIPCAWESDAWPGAGWLPAAPRPGLHLDSKRRAVYQDGQPLHLTAREYQVIELLHASPGRLFGRDEILERLWGLDFPGEARIVDSFIKRLRGKLGQQVIQTVRGLGYRYPLPDAPGVAQPQLEALPPVARLLTRLAGRILQVSDAGQIIASVQALLEAEGIAGVSLWTPPAAPALTWTRLAFAGVSSLAHGPEPQPGRAVTELGSAQVGQPPWARLVFESLQPISAQLRPALDAVAGLVDPALRLNAEIVLRQQAERQLRRLNQSLEQRVRSRTAELAHANAELQALHDLTEQLSGAASLPEVLGRGLSRLARMMGASVCSLWRSSTDLYALDEADIARHAGVWLPQVHCLAACLPTGEPLPGQEQPFAAALESVLAGWLASRPEPGDESPYLTPDYLTPDGLLPGERVMLIPAASQLPGTHLLLLRLAGNAPTPTLMQAAARAFGLAYERQLHTRLLEQAALSDELTGLPNRRAFLGDLGAELSYSQRHRSEVLLSLFEIDGLQALNKQLGFAGGSDLIRGLSQALRGALRGEDRVYRLGGALLASLIRVQAGQAQALVPKLDKLAARTPAALQLRVSHVHAPAEAAEVSDVLYLALQRLEALSGRERPA